MYRIDSIRQLLYRNWQVVARCSIKVLSIFTVKPQVLSELTAAGACQYVLLSVTRAPHLVTSSDEFQE